MSSPIISIFSWKFLSIFIINPCLVIPTSRQSLGLPLLTTFFFPFDKCHILLLHISSIICIQVVVTRKSRFYIFLWRVLNFAWHSLKVLTGRSPWYWGGLLLGFVTVGLVQFCPLSWEMVFTAKVWPSGISIESLRYFISPSNLVDLELLICLPLLGNCWNLWLVLLAFTSWLLGVTPHICTLGLKQRSEGSLYASFVAPSFPCFASSISRHCGSCNTLTSSASVW